MQSETEQLNGAANRQINVLASADMSRFQASDNYDLPIMIFHMKHEIIQYLMIEDSNK